MANDLLDLTTIESIRSLGNEGDVPFINQIIELFFQETDKLINNIRTANENSDFHQVQMSAHTLKGSSANIGAILLSEAAKEIEFSCKENKTGNIKVLISKAEDCFQQTKSALLEQIKN